MIIVRICMKLNVHLNMYTDWLMIRFYVCMIEWISIFFHMYIQACTFTCIYMLEDEEKYDE